MVGETAVGGKVVPQFPQRGMNYFRTLPCTYDSFDPKNFEAADPRVHYWSEKDPSNVGLHTKFRTKLELKTTVTFGIWKKSDNIQLLKVKERDGIRFVSGHKEIRKISHYRNICGSVEQH